MQNNSYVVVYIHTYNSTIQYTMQNSSYVVENIYKYMYIGVEALVIVLNTI